MPPRLRLRPVLGPYPLFAARPRLSRPPACLFCSLQLAKPRPTLLSGARPATVLLRRAASAAVAPNAPATTTPPKPAHARADLERALADLQKHAGVLVNLPRIQLAIRSLQQPPGRESIRVAVLGLVGSGGAGAGNTAKELLRLILADPLESEQEWERQLDSHDAARPLIVRVRGRDGSAGRGQALSLAKDGELDEIEVVSSAGLNGSSIEFLLMESDLAVPKAARGFEGEAENLEETILVPTVDIPVSQEGGGHRSSPVTTPVHQALVVADGFVGAAAVSGLPLVEEGRDEILAAVRLKSHNPDDAAGAPFAAFDAASSAQAIALFRESVANAKAYEKLWLQGGVPAVLGWLKEGAVNRADGTTKPAVRRLIASVLRNALAHIQDAEAKQRSGSGGRTLSPQSTMMPASTFATLNEALADWAEQAHVELQEQLDLAFSGHRWRKLGWWKLFWRADDVTMLSSSLLVQRFLPQSEQDVVYLAGRIEEAARLLEPPAAASSKKPLALYAAPTVLSTGPADAAAASPPTPAILATPPSPRTKWPTQISFTRSYLLDETVPALQALAQKLVLQAAGTSGLTASLAVLTYLSSLGAYEAGAVAALGLVWSLRRMQKQWDTARDFWEGEVREEGRKAVRAVETNVAEALDRTRKTVTGEEGRDRVLDELQHARQLVETAQEALNRLK